MPLQRSPRPAVGGDGLHMNVGIASNPAVESCRRAVSSTGALRSRPTAVRCMTASLSGSSCTAATQPQFACDGPPVWTIATEQYASIDCMA